MCDEGFTISFWLKLRPGKNEKVMVVSYEDFKGFELILNPHNNRKVDWLSRMTAGDDSWVCTVSDRPYPLRWTLYTFQFLEATGCKVFLDSSLVAENDTRKGKQSLLLLHKESLQAIKVAK